ncbi:MAG: hypothetical protein CL424_00130 [Acidimicrobiaceae bacterium]|nr:hypothetical protein [Acidimicrobiaceae bacterium]
MTRQRWRARRVLHPVTLRCLSDYVGIGGGAGLELTRRISADDLIDRVVASGLRGRGGAGFPVGRKWRTVADQHRHSGIAPVVVVNGAEGEPGTFKDRSIIRNNPYAVIEGALIAGVAVGASDVVIATKRSFEHEGRRLADAIAEIRAADWSSIPIHLFHGPDEYLYGEESALLECLDGRGPFPRVSPTYRIGLLETRDWRGVVGPALVNNVESLANVPKIVARGPEWFRRIGTADSPGSSVVTVTGDRVRHGVAEVRLGTPLRTVLRAIGGDMRSQPPIKAVLSGVANPLLLPPGLAAPISYEGLRAAGGGLGSGGFIVFDASTDMAAVAAGVARFLAIESCGQCSPCKLDGLLLAAVLARLCRNESRRGDLDLISRRSRTVAYGARCYLGIQHETVLCSILEHFWAEFEAHASRVAPAVDPVAITELVDIRDGRAVRDDRHHRKQPDWSYGLAHSGKTPAERRSELASSCRVELSSRPARLALDG